MTATSTDRQATIDRAIALIDNAQSDADAAQLDAWLAQTGIHRDLRLDPYALRDKLAAVADDPHSGRAFGAWKAAQQLLRAAGQPY